MTASDQTFRRYNATLETSAAPFNPWDKSGDPADTVRYLERPGVNFFRPWIAIRNGPAFQWPLGMEAFSLTIDPVLGIHKFLGDNGVNLAVDVLHPGEEHLTLSGDFPGVSAPDLIQALRSVVYQAATDEGKILYVPEIMAHAQRVQVVHAEFSRTQDMRGRDSQYSIEFVRIADASLTPETQAQPTPAVPMGTTRGKTVQSVKVDSTHNTLRRIAIWKLGSALRWRVVYDANSKWFISHNISLAKAPDYPLPLGLKVHF